MSKIEEEYYLSCNTLASGKATTWGSKVDVLLVHSGIRENIVVREQKITTPPFKRGLSAFCPPQIVYASETGPVAEIWSSDGASRFIFFPWGLGFRVLGFRV